MSTTPASLMEMRAEPDLSGRRLGDYQLLRRLGRGGMAEVYLAEQTSLRRQVAIKVLRSNLALDDAYVRRFHNEAQAAAKLVHANIVQIHEVGCLEGWHFIAQEYVSGQNLKQLLTRLGHGLDGAMAVNVVRQVAAALHKAAEQNIIHRDIKPENIMIASSGEVKVADFGLARVVRDNEALNLTQVGITMGTPLYMSPEQVEGKQVDPRSDLYSLGVTSYHMLAGRPPFDGDTALAVAIQHLKTDPERLETQRPDLPEGLCRIVHKLLAKKPEDRYQKAVDLLRDLKGIQLPGLDEDWAADLAGYSAADLALSSSGRMEATQQLGRVLKNELRPAGSWTAGGIAGLLLALTAAGFAIGAGIAAINRPEPLLATASGEVPRIKKFPTAQQQFLFAQWAMEDQEDAWKAVAQYFPPEKSPENLRYSRLAMKGLAAHYLSNNRLDEALQLYAQLANVEPSERDFHIVGIIGEAIIYDQLNEPEKVVERLVELQMPNTDLRHIGEFLRAKLDSLTNKYSGQSQEEPLAL